MMAALILPSLLLLSAGGALAEEPAGPLWGAGPGIQLIQLSIYSADESENRSLVTSIGLTDPRLNGSLARRLGPRLELDLYASGSCGYVELIEERMLDLDLGLLAWTNLLSREDSALRLGLGGGYSHSERVYVGSGPAQYTVFTAREALVAISYRRWLREELSLDLATHATFSFGEAMGEEKFAPVDLHVGETVELRYWWGYRPR